MQYFVFANRHHTKIYKHQQNILITLQIASMSKPIISTTDTQPIYTNPTKWNSIRAEQKQKVYRFELTEINYENIRKMYFPIHVYSRRR